MARALRIGARRRGLRSPGAFVHGPRAPRDASSVRRLRGLQRRDEILLDALANDRPVVCVLYDEGVPAGVRHAALNAAVHYEEVIASNAFVHASDFDSVVAASTVLYAPDELSEERRRVTREVMGEVDGHAADRVVVRSRRGSGRRRSRAQEPGQAQEHEGQATGRTK